MRIKPLFIQFFREHWHFIVACFFFILLLARNPYSERTLIPNLEPYPDSIHYISSALSFLHGEGMFISREGRHILPTVPPLYSLGLSLVYLINSDVRNFYFFNVLLAGVSLTIFYFIIKKVFPQKIFLQFFLLFLYTTNYILYWFPELAMAESLLLPLVLATVYALLLPPSRKIAVFISIFSVAFYATKFSSLPISVIVPFLFLCRIFAIQEKKERVEVAQWFFVSFFVSGGVYVLYEYFVRSSNLILGLYLLLISVFSPKEIVSAAQGGTIKTGSFFSLQYASHNANAYIRWLTGNAMTMLWKQVVILPKFLAIPAVIGFILSFFSRRRWFATLWMTMLSATIFVMMTFYVADGRYFIIAVPALIFGVGLFIQWLDENFSTKGPVFARFFLLLFFAAYLITQAQRIKFDVMLNLRHAENPWYYTSVRKFDTYLAEHKNEFTQQPVIISALPPYVIDFYAKQPMLVLPLSPSQEFQSHQQEAWGDHNYEDLPAEYQKYLEEGRPVFLTQYGLGNEKILHVAYDSLFQRFTMKKVAEGCYTLCDVYQITGIKKVNN